VGYEFKRARFEQLHRSALRFPAARFTYVGTPAPDPAAAAQGEHLTLRAFQDDPYGCQGSLRKKRLSRDPFANGVRLSRLTTPFFYRSSDSRHHAPCSWRKDQEARPVTARTNRSEIDAAHAPRLPPSAPNRRSWACDGEWIRKHMPVAEERC
jgi:hypothetical protein